MRKLFGLSVLSVPAVSFAAVPAEVTTALTDAATDAATVAVAVLLIIAGIAAIKYLRRAL